MLVKFDLTTDLIPENVLIIEATLSLYTSGSYEEFFNGSKSLFRISEEWSENSVTWNNQPDYFDTAVAQANDSLFKIWEEYDVSSVVSDIINNSSKNYGFLLRLTYEDDYIGIKIHSSEYSNQPELRPKLTIKCDTNLTIFVQNGGEEWEQNTSQMIRWIDNIGGNVKIDIVENGSVFETIAKSVPSNVSYKWDIPEDLKPGTNYKIRITSIDDPFITDESDETISILEEFIISLPYTQDFDDWSEDAEDMEYWEQSCDDDIDWIIQEGPTPSSGTGADADHSGSGKYIYVESSDPNNPFKKAHIITPKFDFSSIKDPQLTIWYYMFSEDSTMGDFYTDIKVDNNDWQESLMTISGDHGESWKSKTVELKSYVNNNKRVRFRLRGITGSSWFSDICIDDFKIGSSVATVTKLKRLPSSYDLKFHKSLIHFLVPKNVEKKQISIFLYNVKGKLVKTLVNDNFNTGYYSVPLTKLANGLYVCRMEVGKFNKVINVILTK